MLVLWCLARQVSLLKLCDYSKILEFYHRGNRNIDCHTSLRYLTLNSRTYSIYIFRFRYLRTCGCVFSERALKEVKTEICHKVRIFIASFL